MGKHGITSFSSTDIELSENAKIPYYVAGPNGELKKHYPNLDIDVVVFNDLPKSKNKHWLYREFDSES